MVEIAALAKRMSDEAVLQRVEVVGELGEPRELKGQTRPAEVEEEEPA